MIRWLSKLWHGGISGDQFLGIANSVQSAKNVDLRTNGRKVILANKTVRNASGVIADWPMKFVAIKSTGDVIAFGDAGKIYRQVAGAGDFALVYTDTSNRKYTDAYEYNGQLLWTTTSKMLSMAVSDIDAAWSGTVNEYYTFANGNATHHPMIEVYNKLYIGDGKALAELDSSFVFTATKLSIFADETIIGITFNGARVKIYSRLSTNVPYGRCYLWDGVAGAYNEFSTIRGLAPHAVIDKNNLDILIAGEKPVLLASTGLDFQVIKKLPNITGTNTANFNHNCMTANEALIFFGACESGTNMINRGIWSWGAKEKDYPQALGNEHTTSNASATDLVGAVHYSGGKLYSGWKNGSTYGIDIVDNTLYETTGEIVTRVWDADSAYQKKEIIAVRMAFNTLAAGEQIDLYLKRNLSTTWGSAIISVAYSDVADQGINFKEALTSVVGDPFNFLEAKVVLTAGTNQGTSPALTDLVVDANYIEVN